MLDLTLLSTLPITQIRRVTSTVNVWQTEMYQLIRMGSMNIPHELLLVFPHQVMERPHRLSTIQILQFQSPFLDKSSSGFYSPGPKSLPLNKETMASFDEIWDLSCESDTGDHLTQLRLTAGMFKFIVEAAFPGKPARRPNHSPIPIRKRCTDGKSIIYAARYIKLNLCQTDLSLEKIAHAINYNPNYFCSEFKKVMGITPMKYVNKVRIEKVIHLLRTTDESLSTIYQKVGINSVTFMSSQIKRYTGMTPIEYRRSEKIKRINTVSDR